MPQEWTCCSCEAYCILHHVLWCAVLCCACSVVNLAVACVLFPATASAAAVTAYRGFRSLAAHKRWTQRRRRLFGLYALQVRITSPCQSGLLIPGRHACNEPHSGSLQTCHACSHAEAIGGSMTRMFQTSDAGCRRHVSAACAHTACGQPSFSNVLMALFNEHKVQRSTSTKCVLHAAGFCHPGPCLLPSEQCPGGVVPELSRRIWSCHQLLAVHCSLAATQHSFVKLPITVFVLHAAGFCHPGPCLLPCQQRPGGFLSQLPRGTCARHHLLAVLCPLDLLEHHIPGHDNKGLSPPLHVHMTALSLQVSA